MIHHLDAHDLRVLVFAPVGRDAVLTRDLLARASITGEVCPTMTGLTEELERGAGAVVLTEEALDDPLLSRLSAALAQQPAWSEVPILLFAGGDRSQALLRTLAALDDCSTARSGWPQWSARFARPCARANASTSCATCWSRCTRRATNRSAPIV